MQTVIAPRLLLVDDDPLVADVLQAILADAGYSVTTARSVETAMQVLEADQQPVACLVTDVNLNTTASGWDLARAARALYPTLPVVYVSGDSGHDWSAQGVPHSGMLNKPFAPSQLVVMVANQINAKDGEAPAPTDP